MRRVPRYIVQHERLPEGAFPGGAILRGYVRPKQEHIKSTCTCGLPTNKVSNINQNIVKLAEKYEIKAYTLEVYFSHNAPLIRKETCAVRSTINDIIFDMLETLSSDQIEMIEGIQIEFLDGNMHEVSQIEVDEFKLVFLELQRCGYFQQKNDFMAIPAMRGDVF